MKKIVALLLSTAMIFALAACGGAAPAAETAAPAIEAAAETAAPAAEAATEEAAVAEAATAKFDGVTLDFWMPPITGEDQAYWKKHFENFTAETGITVNTTIVDWGDMNTKYMAGFMSGDGPDVFYITNEMMYDMKEAGALMNIAPCYTQEELDNFNYLYGTYTIGDERYSMPFLASLANYRGYFFNMDLLKAAGVEKVPETREELIEVAIKVKEAGVCEYPILYPVAEDNASPYCTIIPMLWSAGADFVSEDGKNVVIDSPEAVDACQFLYDLSNKYEVLSKDCLTMQVAPARDLFLEGKVAIISNEANVMEKSYNDIPFSFDTRIALAPAGKTGTTYASVDQIAANANSKNPEATVALLKFLTSKEHYESFREEMYPTLGQITKDMSPAIFKSPEIEKETATSTAKKRPMPICKGLNLTEVLKSIEQLLVMGEITPEEAVKAMTESFQAALEE